MSQLLGTWMLLLFKLPTQLIRFLNTPLWKMASNWTLLEK